MVAYYDPNPAGTDWLVSFESSSSPVLGIKKASNLPLPFSSEDLTTTASGPGELATGWNLVAVNFATGKINVWTNYNTFEMFELTFTPSGAIPYTDALLHVGNSKASPTTDFGPQVF